MESEKKYMVYSEAQLEKAVDMARRGVSIRQSANSFHVPEATVRRKLKQSKLCSRGKRTILTEEEEKSIIDWIRLAAKAGFPVDAQRLKTSVGYFLRLSGRPNPFTGGIPGRKWLKLFLRRHPEISRRIPSALSKQRTAVSEKQIRNWFSEVGSFINNEKLQQVLEKPECVFNMDESAVRMVPTKEQVFAKTGEKYVHTNNGNSDKESYTALFAANAAGTLAPPLILFPYKQRLPAEIARSAPPGWAVGRNQSGWMTQETYFDYLKNVFVPWLAKTGIPLPIIVFVDGHSSHVSYQTIEYCRANQISLISLFPNSTHVLQPLDVSFFRPLKVQWNKHLIEYRTFHAGESLPKHEIAPLLKKAVDDMKNLKPTLVNGFRKCGIMPWDPSAVNYQMLLQEQDKSSDGAGTHIQLDKEYGEIVEETMVLRGLESYLKVGQLKLFETHQSALIWPGPVGDTNLFYVWQEMKKKAESVSNKPAEVQKDTFYGFRSEELEGDRMHTMSMWDKFLSSESPRIDESIRCMEGHSASENLKEPPGVLTETENLQERAEKDLDEHAESATSHNSSQSGLSEEKENLFNKAFFLPQTTPKVPKYVRKRPRPPAVATSEEYKAWYEKMELDKQKEEQIRAEKRLARDAKKSAALKRRQESKSKVAPKKAKLIV